VVAVLEIIPSTRTLLAPYKQQNIVKALQDTQHLGGCTAELGVYLGGGSRLIADNNGGRMHYAFDSFEGITNAGPGEQGAMAGWTQFKGIDEADIRAYLVAPNVRIIKGYFPDSTAGLDALFSFVHFDGDTEQSCRDFIAYFEPRMLPGGILIFDDYRRACCPMVGWVVDDRFSDVKEISIGQGMVVL
jgi:hypothetical protein